MVRIAPQLQVGEQLHHRLGVGLPLVRANWLRAPLELSIIRRRVLLVAQHLRLFHPQRVGTRVRLALVRMRLAAAPRRRRRRGPAACQKPLLAALPGVAVVLCVPRDVAEVAERAGMLLLTLLLLVPPFLRRWSSATL